MCYLKFYYCFHRNFYRELRNQIPKHSTRCPKSEILDYIYHWFFTAALLLLCKVSLPSLFLTSSLPLPSVLCSSHSQPESFPIDRALKNRLELPTLRAYHERRTLLKIMSVNFSTLLNVTTQNTIAYLKKDGKKIAEYHRWKITLDWTIEVLYRRSKNLITQKVRHGHN